MTIEVKITGNAQRFLDRAPSAMEEAVRDGSLLSAKLILQGVRKASPVLTGALRDSHDRVQRIGPKHLLVGSDLRYSSIIQRRTNYLDVGMGFVRAEMEKNLGETIEKALQEAAR